MTNIAEIAIAHSMGVKGFKYLTTAGTATYAAANMCAIQIIADAEVTCTAVKGDSLSAVTVTAGNVVVGEFSSVTCAGTGGALLAYLA